MCDMKALEIFLTPLKFVYLWHGILLIVVSFSFKQQVSMGSYTYNWYILKRAQASMYITVC